MRGPFYAQHYSDADKNPEGGVTFGPGFTISWQRGPLGRGEERRAPNGAFVETIILAAVDRLNFYQRSKFACGENEEALLYLDRALAALDRRTHDREVRKVDGTHAV